MKKPYEISLRLYGGAQTQSIEYVQGDTDVYPLAINLLDRDDAPYVLPANAVAALNFSTRDGAALRGYAKITDSASGKLLYVFKGEELYYPGLVTAAVEIEYGSKRLTWPKFVFNVTKSLAGADAEPPEYMQPWVAQVDERLGGMSGQLENMEAAVEEISKQQGPPGEAGTKGEKGDKGDTGPQGEPGNAPFPLTSATSTAPATARIGDKVINTGTAIYTIGGISMAIGAVGNITSLSPFTVTAAGNIRGPVGAQGPQGTAGSGKRSSSIIIGIEGNGYTTDEVDYMCYQDNVVDVITYAINNLQSSTDGGEILFLQGNYEFKKPLEISRGYITISGVGPGTAFWGVGLQYLFFFNQCYFITLCNCTIDNLHSNNTIVLDSCKNCKVSNIAIQPNNYMDILLSNSSDCTLEGNMPISTHINCAYDIQGGRNNIIWGNRLTNDGAILLTNSNTNLVTNNIATHISDIGAGNIIANNITGV